MTKIWLYNQEVSICIYSEGGKEPRKLTINNGMHNKKKFSSLVLSEGDVILDGNDGMFVLATGTKTITVNITDTLTKLAKQLGNEDIYFNGIDAVPEGKEKELLQALI